MMSIKLTLAVIMVAAGFNAGAETTNAPGRVDIQAFRIVTERNIFNPNRSTRAERDTTRREPERQVKSESFALVGTMSYEKGWLAFFDGSSPDYKKALKPDETIAGYKITGVAHDSVTLRGSNDQVELRIGMQMKRRDEGEWRAEEGAAEIAAKNAAATGEAKAESSSSDEQNDVLKRLMQQREKELDK